MSKGEKGASLRDPRATLTTTQWFCLSGNPDGSRASNQHLCQTLWVGDHGVMTCPELQVPPIALALNPVVYPNRRLINPQSSNQRG
jgi:hypothetical protein